jgi:hypothetical protein
MGVCCYTVPGEDWVGLNAMILKYMQGNDRDGTVRSRLGAKIMNVGMMEDSETKDANDGSLMNEENDGGKARRTIARPCPPCPTSTSPSRSDYRKGSSPTP